MEDTYLGKVNNIITATELNSLLGLSVGTNIVTGDITWLKFLTKEGKLLFVADRCIKNNISYGQLESAGIVKAIASGYNPEQQGKIISIDNKQYKCRLLTGGNSNPSTSQGGEWNRFIVKFVPNNADSNWDGMWSWCQEIRDSTTSIVRGGSSVSYYTDYTKTFTLNGFGFRPVLELDVNLKHLIKSLDKIKTLVDGEWIDTEIAETPTSNQMETYGMDDLTSITEEKWSQLQSPIEILTWTNSMEVNSVNVIYNKKEFTSPKLELTVDEYKPIMTLHEPEIITLTDADNPKLHIEGFRDLRPYCESENPKLLILSQADPNMYTNVIPNPQLILPKGDIQFKMLDKILSFNMAATEQNKGLIKIIFSVDSGNTWKVYDESIQDFKEINIQDLDVVENEGMTVPVFNAIGERWNDIIKQNKIRFGYYLEIEELEDVAEVDKLDVTIDALGSWNSVIHGVDYNYKYDNEKIYIELYRNGSYKINYI